MASTITTTRFGLIRHAETIWNREKRIQGHKDAPLTRDGKQRARIWGVRLKQYKWDRILSSDSGRAIKTAERINETLQIPFHSDERLREQDWGLWTGKTEIELKREASESLDKAIAMGWEFCPPGGENRLQVWRRSVDALEAGAANWPGKSILIVTHEGVIKCLVNRLHKRKFLPGETQLILPYHLHRLIYNSAGLQAVQINALALE